MITRPSTFRGRLAGLGLAAAALLAAPAAPARAQIEAGTQLLSLGLGGSNPFTDLDLKAAGGGLEPAAASGISGSAQLIYHVSPRVGFGAEATGSRFTDRTHNLPRSLARTGASLVSFHALARANFRPDRAWNPFLIGGVGVGLFSANIVAQPIAPNTWQNINAADSATAEERKVLDESSNGISATLGGGIELVGKRLVVGFEARWNYVGISARKFGTNSFNAVSGQGRIGLKLGPFR